MKARSMRDAPMRGHPAMLSGDGSRFPEAIDGALDIAWSACTHSTHERFTAEVKRGLGADVLTEGHSVISGRQSTMRNDD